MLESASGRLPSYPGHPPAAKEGLMSLLPDFILGPRKALDFGELQQPGRRGTTRFGTGSRVPMDWAASASKPGRQSFHRTSRTAIPRDTAVMSTPQALCHGVRPRSGQEGRAGLPLAGRPSGHAPARVLGAPARGHSRQRAVQPGRRLQSRARSSTMTWRRPGWSCLHPARS